jgi:hypothetical protein
MNERLRELAEKSSIAIHPRKQTGSAVDCVCGSQFDIEKFSELIIKECIDKITTYDLVPGHSAKWEDIYDIHSRLLQDLGEELKEHFGVTK